jgi:hypothetical protein
MDRPIVDHGYLAKPPTLLRSVPNWSGTLGNEDPIEGHSGGRRTTRGRRRASNETAQGGYRVWADANPARELCPKRCLADSDGRTAMAPDTPYSEITIFRRFHGISFLGSNNRFSSAATQ